MRKESLQSRLEQAGIYGLDGRLPLEEESLENVFHGLGRLIGSDYPAQLLEQGLLERCKAFLPSDWDQTYDAAVDGLSEGLQFGAAEDARASVKEVYTLLYRLMIEPFCLMHQANDQGGVK